MAKSWRKRSRYTGKKFQPYTRAIGEFALAWNDLHEALGNLFLQAVGYKGITTTMQLIAIWGSVVSDRQKRDMLTSAINRIGRIRHEKAPMVVAEVLWILECANKLEDRRNNVIHSPLDEMMNALAAGLDGVEPGEVIPGGSLNFRSQRFSDSLKKSGRKLLQEVRFYRDYATALAVYAREITLSWEPEENRSGKRTRPWPGRPALPRLRDRS